MNRLKGLAFVIVLSLVSAVTLRLLLDRATRAMGSGGGPPQPQVTALEVERRFVGCGAFRFAFDSLGYSSRQWPLEVAGGTPAANAAAVFLARSGELLPVLGERLGAPLGSYALVGVEVHVALGPDTALLAVLGPRGDSLAGTVALRRRDRGGALLPVGRVFLETPVPRPAACDP